MQEDEFVLPGDEIATTEEYTPGIGTYELDGKILSSGTGNIVFDDSRRVASIRSVREGPQLPSPGDRLLARVTDVRQNMVLLDMLSKDGSRRKLSREAHASMHISKITGRYIRSPGQFFGEGDLIRCEVISNNPVVFVNTIHDELGVVFAECGYCALELVREGTLLRCPGCNRIFKRYLASDYGRISVIH